jgi:hypothetical protein
MLATRWATVDALGAALAPRGPSVCAVCRGWGRGRVCSTAAEPARVLKQAGAKRVEIWVLARTPRPEDA